MANVLGPAPAGAPESAVNGPPDRPWTSNPSCGVPAAPSIAIWPWGPVAATSGPRAAIDWCDGPRGGVGALGNSPAPSAPTRAPAPPGQRAPAAPDERAGAGGPGRLVVGEQHVRRPERAAGAECHRFRPRCARRYLGGGGDGAERGARERRRDEQACECGGPQEERAVRRNSTVRVQDRSASSAS